MQLNICLKSFQTVWKVPPGETGNFPKRGNAAIVGNTVPVFPPPHIDGIVSIVVSPILWIALSLRQICVLFKININFPVESTVLIASVVLMAFGRNLWIHCNLEFRLLCREFKNVVKYAPFVLFLFGRNFRLCHFYVFFHVWWLYFSLLFFRFFLEFFIFFFQNSSETFSGYTSSSTWIPVPWWPISSFWLLYLRRLRACLFVFLIFCNLPFMDIFVILYLNLLNVRECEWGPIFKIFF